MTETRELICIGCPLGCMLTVTLEENKPVSVAGNTCPRGEAYAKKEVTNPRRIVTSTVRIKGMENLMLPVKTSTDIPKDKIFACMEALRGIEAELPVRCGDVLLKDVLGTGADILATKSMEVL